MSGVLVIHASGCFTRHQPHRRGITQSQQRSSEACGRRVGRTNEDWPPCVGSAFNLRDKVRNRPAVRIVRTFLRRADLRHLVVAVIVSVRSSVQKEQLRQPHLTCDEETVRLECRCEPLKQRGVRRAGERDAAPLYTQNKYSSVSSARSADVASAVPRLPRRKTRRQEGCSGNGPSNRTNFRARSERLRNQQVRRKSAARSTPRAAGAQKVVTRVPARPTRGDTRTSDRRTQADASDRACCQAG